MPPLIDLSGKKFGKLTVVSKNSESPNKMIQWLCQCECGKAHIALGSNLRKGHTMSCGCLKVEKSRVSTRKHGHATIDGFSGAYKSWAKMRERAWDDFKVFYRDMGPRPDGCSIERIDRNGNYEKSNCIWADHHQQANNKRNNISLEWRGETKTLTQWAEKIGISRGILYKRIHTHKWSIDKAMTQPARHPR